MDRFWIIPIIAFISVIASFAVFQEYRINVVIPNAALELEDMKSMECSEIMKKNSLNRYWLPSNGKIGRAMNEVCVESLKDNSGNPYVKFCSTAPLDPPFWPDKLIQNSTHKFNHEFCVWEKR